MGVNQTIEEGTRDFLWTYGCEQHLVSRFLRTASGFEERRDGALAIIRQIIVNNGKQEVLGHLDELCRVEHGIRELDQKARDHVVHALLTFLLGVHLDLYFLKVSLAEPLEWKIAGLLHDVAYPAQTAAKLSKSFADQMNAIGQSLDADLPTMNFAHELKGLDRLTDGASGLSLIQGRIDSWGLRISAGHEYAKKMGSGEICHGMLSGLAILKIIDLMYHKYNPRGHYHDVFTRGGINWNRSFFDDHIVSACSAIFIHNLPDGCFEAAPLRRERAPLAFLLRPADCLQDWWRPLWGNPDGFPDDMYEMRVDDGTLIFIASDPVRRRNIEEGIGNSLVASDILIL